MLWSRSAGDSKFGAVTKDSAPLDASIWNLAASSPPTIENASDGPSGSVTVTVVTAVAFSCTLMLAVAPPPFDVMLSGSFCGVTVMAKVCPVIAGAMPSLTEKPNELLDCLAAVVCVGEQIADDVGLRERAADAKRDCVAE